MRNIAFITHNAKDEADGVWKKIVSQVDAFKSLGYAVDFFYTESDNIVMEKSDGKRILRKIQPSKYFFYKTLLSIVESEKLFYEYAYFRKPHGGFFSFFLPGLAEYFKRQKTKVFMEIPTYPYYSELKSLKDKISEFCFLLVRKSVTKNIDRIIYMGTLTNEIWGVDALRISNGINIDKLPLTLEDFNPDEIHIVAVANLEFWHGYDRVIRGLQHYKSAGKITFHVVGPENEECKRLRKLAQECGVNNLVKFHGKQTGSSLSTILLNADICIDAVGRHRSGNNINSSIKSKEYTARGIPFVKSHEDYAFNDLTFIFQAPDNDSPLDMESIVSWREKLKPGFSILEREYAKKHLTWEAQLSTFLDK